MAFRFDLSLGRVLMDALSQEADGAGSDKMAEVDTE